MTTKEEVLRLAEAAGFTSAEHFKMIYSQSSSEGGLRPSVALIKLIELAKQAGAKEEREACLKICEDFNQLAVESRTRLSSAFECAEAICNRKANHEQ